MRSSRAAAASGGAGRSPTSRSPRRGVRFTQTATSSATSSSLPSPRSPAGAKFDVPIFVFATPALGCVTLSDMRTAAASARRASGLAIGGADLAAADSARSAAVAKAPPRLAKGSWAVINGLQQEPQHNGKVARIVHEPDDDDDDFDGEDGGGRYQVEVDGGLSVRIRGDRLTPVPATDLVPTVLLPCLGDRELSPWITRMYPRQHTIFAAPPRGNAPLAALLGVPLMLRRERPRCASRTGDGSTSSRSRAGSSSAGAAGSYSPRSLAASLSTHGDRADLDNEMAAHLMLDPVTGLIPPDWRASAGNVLVWRPGGKPLSGHDVMLLHDLFSGLLGPLFATRSIVPEEHLVPSIMAWSLKRMHSHWAKRPSPSGSDDDDEEGEPSAGASIIAAAVAAAASSGSSSARILSEDRAGIVLNILPKELLPGAPRAPPRKLEAASGPAARFADGDSP